MPELLVGRVLEVRHHPGSRAPSYVLLLDLGPRGEREAQMEPGMYGKDELVGRLVVASIEDEAIVLCARSHAHGSILVGPDREVEVGAVVA